MSLSTENDSRAREAISAFCCFLALVNFQTWALVYGFQVDEIKYFFAVQMGVITFDFCIFGLSSFVLMMVRRICDDDTGEIRW